MKFCDPHVKRMRAVCCDLGLETLISRDEAHLRERLARRDPFDIDPLYHSLLALMALSKAVVRNNKITEALIGCPLCFFHEESLRSGWVDNVAKATAALVIRRHDEKLADAAHQDELNKAQRS